MQRSTRHPMRYAPSGAALANRRGTPQATQHYRCVTCQAARTTRRSATRHNTHPLRATDPAHDPVTAPGPCHADEARAIDDTRLHQETLPCPLGRTLAATLLLGAGLARPGIRPGAKQSQRRLDRQVADPDRRPGQRHPRHPHRQRASGQPQQASPAPAATKPPAVSLNIQFATGSADLTPQATHALDQLGQALSTSTLAAYHFRIEGHTDTVGTADHEQVACRSGGPKPWWPT